jgi:predicted alpha/beta superfamily hydrolase
MKLLGLLVAGVVFLVTAAAAAPAPGTGRFVVFDTFASRYVTPRKVVVWLPDGYDEGTDRYAVLYMHDGRNLFDPATSMGHEPWAVDQHLAALINAHRVRKTLVVGIDHGTERWREYAPQAPFETLSADLREPTIGESGGPPISDAYLQFLVEELKPFIDSHFRTHPERANTVVAGSSMGGLISLYAVARYPEIFGGAAALSTHWPYTVNFGLLAHDDPRVVTIADGFIRWLDGHLPDPATHRIYMDHGTQTLDALYAPYQARVDSMFESHGYYRSQNFDSRVFEGAEHNEPAWRARLDIPLSFLLAP